MMKSWVRYSVAAYAGLMFAGTLGLTGPKVDERMVSASHQTRSGRYLNYGRPSSPRDIPRGYDRIDQTSPRHRSNPNEMLQIRQA